ncbi:AAA family ATPase [candidate division KSB1 bacterium]|nr:AAA family ATPase [candidate division KSB1 bacterium]MBL7092355.1 AAA family ATPase [candidate division KSB1 bacterium]
MFKNIRIEGLRAIQKIELEDFQQFNLLVGGNNSSKTTLLEGLFLLTGPTNAHLPLKINNFRGFKFIDENVWRLIFNNLNVNSSIKISGELKNPDQERKLIIKPSTKSLTHEKLSKTSIDNGLIEIKDSYSESIPKIEGLTLEYFLKKIGEQDFEKIKSNISLKGSELEFLKPKDYKEVLQGVFLNVNTMSRDISSRFSNIQIRKQADKIIKILQRIEPDLINLILGKDGIIYCDIGLDRMLPINIMGDGIIRILAIILSISDTQNGIIFIDEIENGLHFSSQEIMWDAVFSAAKEFNVQVFATTHSLECVMAYEKSYSQIQTKNDDIRLYRIERKKDTFKVITYKDEKLKASLESGWEVR